MKFKIISLILTLLSLSMLSLADSVSKHEKLLEYANITGFYQDMETVAEENKKASPSFVSTLMDNFITNNPNVSPLGEAKAFKVYKEYMSKVSYAVSAKESVEIWIEIFSPLIAESDLDEILSFYNSPVGQKYATATSAVTPTFSKAMNEAVNIKVQKELVILNKDIRKIINANQKK